MRRLEFATIMISILMALGAAGLWLYTEWSHHRTAVLMDRLLTGKPPGQTALKNALEPFPCPQGEILPGKHLFYAGTLAVTAAENQDLPTVTRLQWLSQARNALKEALMRDPARPHSWTHLAYAAYILDGPCREAIEALRMSIYTSPADKQILLWRLKLAGSNRDFWDHGFHDLVLRQITLAWQHYPKPLAKMAEKHNIGDLIREMLRNNPDELDRFEAMKKT